MIYCQKQIKPDALTVRVTQFINLDHPIRKSSLKSKLKFKKGVHTIQREIGGTIYDIIIKRINSEKMIFTMKVHLNANMILRDQIGDEIGSSIEEISVDGNTNFIPLKYLKEVNISKFVQRDLPEFIFERCTYLLETATTIVRSYLQKILSAEIIIPTRPHKKSFCFETIEIGFDKKISKEFDPARNDMFLQNWALLVSETQEQDYLDYSTADNNKIKKLFKKQKLRIPYSFSRKTNVYRFLCGPLYKGKHITKIYIKDKSDPTWNQLRIELSLYKELLYRIIRASDVNYSSRCFNTDSDIRKIFNSLIPVAYEYISNVLGYHKLKDMTEKDCLKIAKRLLWKVRTPKGRKIAEQHLNEIYQLLKDDYLKVNTGNLSRTSQEIVKNSELFEHIKGSRGVYTFNMMLILLEVKNEKR